MWENEMKEQERCCRRARISRGGEEGGYGGGGSGDARMRGRRNKEGKGKRERIGRRGICLQGLIQIH